MVKINALPSKRTDGDVSASRLAGIYGGTLRFSRDGETTPWSLESGADFAKDYARTRRWDDAPTTSKRIVI
jgi:hypothetical protein